MIRLRLTSGPIIEFDNFIDLFDYVIERMARSGDL